VEFGPVAATPSRAESHGQNSAHLRHAAGSQPQRFADSFAVAVKARRNFANDVSEHETDLFRDQPNGKPLS
jgi:hypothetical protein